MHQCHVLTEINWKVILELHVDPHRKLSGLSWSNSNRLSIGSQKTKKKEGNSLHKMTKQISRAVNFLRSINCMIFTILHWKSPTEFDFSRCKWNLCLRMFAIFSISNLSCLTITINLIEVHSQKGVDCRTSSIFDGFELNFTIVKWFSNWWEQTEGHKLIRSSIYIKPINLSAKMNKPNVHNLKKKSQFYSSQNSVFVLRQQTVSLTNKKAAAIQQSHRKHSIQVINHILLWIIKFEVKKKNVWMF